MKNQLLSSKDLTNILLYGGITFFIFGRPIGGFIGNVVYITGVVSIIVSIIIRLRNKRNKNKLPPRIKNLFEEIIERGRLANERIKNEPKQSHVMTTKEEIYEKLNEILKLNPDKLSEETLSQIGEFEILKITSETKNTLNEIEYKFRWNDKIIKHTVSSDMCKAEDWALSFYTSIYYHYDPQNNDPRIREAARQAAKEAEENLINEPRILGFCHTFDAEQKRILKEKYGIDWKSLSERHPDVKYD